MAFSELMSGGASLLLGSSQGEGTGLFEVSALVPMGLGSLVGIVVAMAAFDIVSDMVSRGGGSSKPPRMLTEKEYERKVASDSLERKTAEQWAEDKRFEEAYAAFEAGRSDEGESVGGVDYDDAGEYGYTESVGVHWEEDEEDGWR